ncbi:MAG: MMPL family transporter [Pirellulales bacterium]
MADNFFPDSRSARLFARIIDHRWVCSAVICLMTALALGGYLRPNWPKEFFGSMFPSEKPDDSGKREVIAAALNNRPSRFVQRSSIGSADCFVVAQSDRFFTREGADALREITSALRDLKTVQDVRWLEDAPPLNIFGLTEPVFPRGQPSQARFDAAKEKALKHPLAVGLYVSSDARTMLIGVDFNWFHVNEDADCTTEIVKTAQAAADRHPEAGITVGITGRVPLRLAFLANQASDEFTFQLIGYGMTLIMATIFFRGLIVVAVTASAPAMGVFWTLGFLRYFGWEDNPFSQVILPVLLSLIGFADGVHMMVFIRRCMADGLDPKTACRNALATVGVACALTTITTAIGMGSLAFSRNEIVREFAFSCVLGTSTILTSVLLLIPLACSSWWGKRLAKGSHSNPIDRNLQRIAIPVAAMMKRPRTSASLAIGLFVIMGLTTLQLRPDDRRTTAFPTGSDAQKYLAILDQSMGGLEVANIEIHWDPGNIDSQETAEIIHRIDVILDREPMLAHPVSLCRVLAALPGDEGPIEKMPLSELLPPPIKLALYDPDNRHARVLFRVQDLGSAVYKSVFERLQSGLDELSREHPAFHFHMTGEPIYRWQNLFKIISDLATSLGTASIEIFIVMGVAFRSLRLGLIAIVPNMIPLCAAGTFMAIAGWPLDIVSVCSFTVCLGIAVDDTIHFLSRYQEEQHHQPDQFLALKQAFEGVGTGVIMTTIVLLAGLSSVLFSRTEDHRVFGWLGIITLASALLCDLFLLPGLLLVFDKSKKKTGDL